MIIGRRALLVAAGCVLVSRQVRGADDQIALYWTVTPPGRQSAALFGYDRVAAALTPEIIKDGISLVDGLSTRCSRHAAEHQTSDRRSRPDQADSAGRRTSTFATASARLEVICNSFIASAEGRRSSGSQPT
jgi:hypothetical protein